MSHAARTRDHFPVVVHTLVLRSRSMLMRPDMRPDTRPDTRHLPTDAEVLLLRRAGTGYGDGLHQPPGGHVTLGESPIAAALRECREEAGIEIAAADLLPVCVMPYGSPGGQGVDFIMAAWLFTGTPRIGEPHKADAIGWHHVHELPETAVPFLADALECLAKDRWYHEFGY